MSDLARRMDASSANLEALSDEALDRIETAGEGTVVLVDRSGSMSSRAGSSTSFPIKTRHVAMCEALDPFRADAQVIAFDDQIMRVGRHDRIPPPHGGTDVALAIKEATKLVPARTILICDGEPESEEKAFKAAEELPGILDTIFIGDDSNEGAKKFMEDLARRCGGTYYDLASAKDAKGQLSEALSTLLLNA